jgi:hypothetical protein
MNKEKQVRLHLGSSEWGGAHECQAPCPTFAFMIVSGSSAQRAKKIPPAVFWRCDGFL